MDERRKFVRCRPASSLRVLDRKTGQPVGRLGNVTDEGMMLISQKPINTGSLLQLQVAVPEEIKAGGKIMFDGKSVWCKEDADSGLHKVGFKLMNVIPKDIEMIKGMVGEPALQR